MCLECISRRTINSDCHGGEGEKIDIFSGDKRRGEFIYDAYLVGEIIEVVGGLDRKSNHRRRLTKGCGHE